MELNQSQFFVVERDHAITPLPKGLGHFSKLCFPFFCAQAYTWDNFLLGSVAEYCTRHSKTPIMVGSSAVRVVLGKRV